MTVSAVTPLFVPPPGSVPGHRAPTLRRGLPLASVPSPRPPGAAVYGMAAMDCRGRIADQAVLRALGWPPGTPTDVRTSGGIVIVAAGAGDAGTVTTHGHLRLPAAIRHRLGLQPGDRVLLVGRPTEARLIIYPPAALDELLACADLDPSGGSPT